MPFQEDKTMKNTLIITLGILALSLLAVPANAQTLKADTVQFITVAMTTAHGLDHIADESGYSTSDISSVILPSTKDPKCTVVFKDGTTAATTNPVLVVYRPKAKGSEAAATEED
jgi:hypothetical protein